MLFQIKSFIKFLLASRNEHGVHSPFIFNLITKCFYKKVNIDRFSSFKNYQKNLFKNKETIVVTDFGKGSKVFKSNKRDVSKIAKIAGISNAKAKLLIKITEYFDFKNVLEIGTSLGIGTSCIKVGAPNSTIKTLEGCPETSKIAQKEFEKNSFSNTEFIVGDFKKTLPESLKEEVFDMIYFDGNHQKEPTLEYFNQCISHIHNDSVFIFDDIHWSEEMLEAWTLIKAHPKVTVTIDVYFWGIVFFRKEQLKEHFVIRP